MNSTLRSKQVTHEEEKVCLKEVYSAFYHQLVGAISDEQVCQSLSTQLRSSAVIPEEKISQLISSRASGSSFLNILGVEEQSGLVTGLIESMSAVKQLQTLASEMGDMLSSKQSAATTKPDTVEPAHIERKVRQQLEEDIKGLTSDKADLLTRLQYCEEDLKTAIDLSIMREKALSGMLATASRRDTGVEGTIRLKSMDLNDDSLQKDIIPDSPLESLRLSELATQVCTVSHWWYPLGILLGLSCATLKRIEIDCSGAMEMCLFKMLDKCRRRGIECSKQVLQNASKKLTPQLVYFSAQQTVSIADLSKVPDGTLDQTHLLVLITALSSVSQWWFSLGIYLGLYCSIMESIVVNQAGQVESCMIEMLIQWLWNSPEEPTKQCLQNGLKLLTHHLLSSRTTTAQQFGYCYPPPPYTRLEEPISIVDLSDIPDGTLDKNLSKLIPVLVEVYQWFPLGMHLGLSHSELHDIRRRHYGDNKVILCMIAMLSKWLEGPIEKRNKQCLQDALKQLTPQLVSQVYPPPTLEKPLVLMKEIQPLPVLVPQTDLERQAVNEFTKNVRVVIQTRDEAEYYAALERLEPPRIENYSYDKPVQYPHSELSFVVGTFAGINAAIIVKEEIFSAELETIFKNICTSTKLLLGLGFCSGYKLAKLDNIDPRIADVLVASEISISQLDSDAKEKVHKVAPSVYQLFCENPDTWDGMVVCEEPNKRIANVHIGRLFDERPYYKQRIEYLGAGLKKIQYMYIPSEIKFVIIKGIASNAGGNQYYTKWQLTAATAAVDYAHHKLERAGYIDFDNF